MVIRKLLAAIGIGIATSAQAVPPVPPRYAPYKNEAFNFIYNLLFCDDLELFRSGENKNIEGPWVTLLAKNPDAAALRAIAEDTSQESRLRVLAYNRLREKKESVPPKKLLGVIIEVGLEGGLDVLAAFPDGRVRYLNHSEKMAVFEPAPPEIEAKIRKLLAASQTAVDCLGPWEKARLAPPSKGTVPMTFLVSDGPYFGQGGLNYMQRDTRAGPIFAATEDLLLAVVDLTLKQEKKPDQGL